VDTQQPHEQDEIYIVAAGQGVFRRGADRVPFGPGDFLFVSAGVPHAFETFSGEFQTWVILFGPSEGRLRYLGSLASSSWRLQSGVPAQHGPTG